MKKILISIAVILMISLSYLVLSQTTGEFTIGNEAPIISDFEVQDGANSWDSTILDTHDLSPTFRWIATDPNPDTLTSTLCISSSPGACDIHTEPAIPTNNGATTEYTYTGILPINQATDCTATSCSKASPVRPS